MNAGLLAGLAGGLGAYREERQQNRALEQQMMMEERKQQMRLDMEKQLLQAKAEYAKANPTYGKFFQGRFGDIVGVDDFGKTATVYTAPEEERQSYQEEYDYQKASKLAQAEAAQARAQYQEQQGLLAPALAASLVASREAQANKASTPKETKDEFALMPADWNAKRKNFMPAIDALEQAIDPVATQKTAEAAAEQAMIEAGYTKKSPAAKDSGLVAPSKKVMPLEDKAFMDAINKKANALKAAGAPEDEINAAVEAAIKEEAALRGYAM